MKKDSSEDKQNIKNLKYLKTLIFIGVIICAIAIIGVSMVDSVDSHEYKIKQAQGTGKLSAIMKPGWYMRNFGKVYKFPKTDTVYFRKIKDENLGIDVIFSDNSKCTINGTARITMPIDPEKAIDIVYKHSNKNFDDFKIKNVLPLIKKSLIVAASTMTAPEGKKRMNDIAIMAQDQLNGGVYELITESVTEHDAISGEMITKPVKRVRMKDGHIVRYNDDRPLKDFGVEARNLVVEEIVCEAYIETQIAEQQKAQMEITTSKTLAARAKQDKITAEQEGEAEITKLQKQEEAISQKLIVQADRDKRIEIINAAKRVEVAKQMVQEEKLLLEAAELNAKSILITAEAEAKAAKLAITADNLLPERLAAFKEISIAQAAAIENLKLPQVLIIGSEGKDKSSGGDLALQILAATALMNNNTAKELGIDQIKKKQ